MTLSGLSLFNVRNSNETLSAVLAVKLLQLQYSESVLNSGTILNNKYNVYTIQAVYVYRKIEARSRNHCCRGKEITITYYVALVILHAMGLRLTIL